MEINFEKIYKKQDIDDLREWMAQHTLPPTMLIEPSTYTDDLPQTVAYLLEQAEHAYSNPNLYGCIYLLERIRQQLEASSETHETKEE